MNLQSQIKPPHDLSIDAFFEWSEHREERYELVRGSPHLQPWVKRNHSRIASNASYLLQSLLNRDLYDVHQGDFAIATGPTTIRYADVLVEPAGGPGQERTAEKALVVIEILFPSTAEEDLGPKREEVSKPRKFAGLRRPISRRAPCFDLGAKAQRRVAAGATGGGGRGRAPRKS